ncbi:MAG: zf-HC2 domain-containing protein [Acidimicrobiia bacterium]
MTHPRELLSAHLDGELTADEGSRVDLHLATCADCTHELRALASVRTALRSLPELEPPTPLMAARSWSLVRWGGGAAAAAAVALAVVLAVAPGDRPAVLDLDTMAEQHTARLVVDPGISTIRGPVGGP